MASDRRVTFLVSANIKNFTKGLNNAQKKLRKFGRNMKRTGRSMTRNITVPLATAGAAAIKFSSDFETSLKQARAQADLTSKEVGFIGDSAEDIAIRTGEATADIIEAYKFTMSAGFDLAESQETVEAAAEASAAGFGEQRDLVRLTTTALQAYAGQVDSSREFMDLLVGSAQAMELEVSKLGPALQRNVGVAKELDIELDQLLAGIGSVSEIMGDAQRGGRMFQTMLSKLLKPSAAGEAAISDMFGSLENLHRSIREEGLLDTMVTLRQRLEEAGGGFEDVFTGQRGLEAALNFTNRAGERTNEILSDMGDTAGSTNEAFDNSADFSRRLSQAWEALQAAMRPIGNILMDTINPLIDRFTDFAQKAAGQLKNLSDATTRAGLIIAGVLGSSGIILSALGTLLLVLGSISWPVVLGVTALVGATSAIVSNWDSLVDYFDGGEGAKIWDKVKGYGQSLFESLKSLFRSGANALQGIWDVFGDDIIKTTERALDIVRSALETGLDSLGLALDVFSARWATDWDGFWSDNEDRVRRFGENVVDIFLDTGEKLDNAFGKLVIDTSDGISVSWETMNNEIARTPQIFSQMQSPISGFFNNFKQGAGIFKTQAQQMIDDTLRLQEFLNMDLSLPTPKESGGGGGGGQDDNPFQGADNPINSANSALASLGSTLDASGGKLQKASSKFDTIKGAMKGAKEQAEVMGQALQSSVTSAVTGFAETLGSALTGDAGAEGFFNNLLLVVVDFANQFGKLLISAGVAAQAFQSLLANPIGAIIAGGALVAATTAVKNLLQQGPQGQAQGMQQGGIVPSGFPNDTYPAMLSSGETVIPSPKPLPSGMGGKQKIENHLYIDGREVEVALEDRKYGRNR